MSGVQCGVVVFVILEGGCGWEYIFLDLFMTIHWKIWMEFVSDRLLFG